MNPSDANPADLAHARLIAHARESRRVANQLPELSPELRRRLQIEVERYARGLAPDRSSSPTTGEGWRRWLAPTAWLAAAVAFVILAFIRLASNPDATPRPGALLAESTSPFGSRPDSTAVAPPDRVNAAAGPAAQADAPAAALATRSSRLAAADVAPTALRKVAATAAPAPAPAPAPAASPTVRVRGSFRSSKAATDSTTARPLERFEVVRVGERVELRDDDGSVFSGRVQPLGAGSEVPTSWSYEASGFSRKLAAPVVITGNFSAPAGSPPANPVDPAAEAVVDSFLDLPFTATVLVDGMNALEIEAAPLTP